MERQQQQRIGQERCTTAVEGSEEVVALQHAVSGQTENCVSILETSPIMRKSCHGPDLATTIQTSTSQTHPDMSILCKLWDQVLPADHDLFCFFLDTHLLRPLHALCGWIAINRDLILWSAPKLPSRTGTKPLIRIQYSEAMSTTYSGLGHNSLQCTTQ
jgi:hypothetical protein